VKQLSDLTCPSTGPEGVHHRKPCHILPFGAEVVDMPRQRSGIEPERRVADNQRGIRDRQHSVEIRRVGNRSRTVVVSRSQNDSRQRYRSPRTGIHRQSLNLLRRNAGYKENAANGSVRCDPQPRNIRELLPLHLNGGDDSHIHRAFGKGIRAGGRYFKPELNRILLRAMQKAPDKRFGIQKTDGANSKWGQLRVYNARDRRKSGKKEYCLVRVLRGSCYGYVLFSEMSARSHQAIP
jgi:hypothetical protein